MKIKRNIAGISALGLIGALSLTAVPALSNNVKADTKFGDINSDGYIDAVDASIILSYYSYVSTAEGTPMTLEQFMAKDSDKTEPATSDSPEKDVSLRTGGDTFTLVSWNHDEIPSMIANWKGLDAEEVIDSLYSESGEGITTASGAKINFINLGTSGGRASDSYDEMFNQGEDIDIYLAEPYWALKYMDNDALSAPLSSLGITEKDMGEWYPYTKKLAQNSKGVYKAVPYCIAPGAFVYRSDIAEKYLRVKNPEEMQAAIGDWDKFLSSAKTIAEKTGGKIAFADSIGGMWEAYSCGRFDFVTSNNKLDMSDDVRAFADMAKELWENGGVAKNNQWTDEWVQSGQEGHCMGYFVPSWAIYSGSFICDAAKNQTGKWSICLGPQSYYWGGNEILINPSTDNGDDVKSFVLSFGFNSGCMMQYARQRNKDNHMPNNMSVNAQLAKENFYHDTEMQEILNAQNYYDVFDQSGRNIDMKKYTHYDDTIKTNIISEIQESYIEKGRSWDDTMTVIRDRTFETYPELK